MVRRRSPVTLETLARFCLRGLLICAVAVCAWYCSELSKQVGELRRELRAHRHRMEAY